MKFFTQARDLFHHTYNRLWEFNIGLHGAAIAFYAIFSTAPLIIIVVWILSKILGEQLGQTEFQQTLESVLGEQMAKTVSKVAKSTSGNETGLWSSLIAAGTLVLGATTLLAQLKQTLNMIWDVESPQTGTVWLFLWNRFVGLLFIGSLSLLFIAGLVSESLLYGLESILVPIVGSKNLYLIQSGSSIINVLLAITFFIVLFRVLPDVNARWRDIAVGASVTTLLVLLGKTVIDWYIGSAALEPTYKAAGSFVVFLIWIYYNVQVVLVGAIFTQVFTTRYGSGVKPIRRE